MGEYLIKVEIPDGEYCENDDCKVWCDYMGDNHYHAASCNLLRGGETDVSVDYEKGHTPEDALNSEMRHKKRVPIRIVKHSNCPSKMIQERKQ